MKVSIIGGGGLVGSCAGFALQTRRHRPRDRAARRQRRPGRWAGARPVARRAEHRRPDHHTPAATSTFPTSDVICITAGLRRKPDESRLDLINRNVDLFVTILDAVQAGGTEADAIVFVVSNPVDMLTYLAAQRLGLPAKQVIGLGTQLDTIRFRSLIAAELKAPPTQVKALILGEHGDSMVPIWSSATIAGLPLDKYPGWNANMANELFTRTKGSGAEVIQRQRGRRLCRRHRHSGRDRSRSRSTAGRCCPSRACRTAVTAFATSRSRCPRSSVDAAWSTAWKSNSGPKRCRACATAATCCGRRSKRCSPAFKSPSGGLRLEPQIRKAAAGCLPQVAMLWLVSLDAK